MATAFETTAERYQRRIYSFARYLLSDAEEAEDVTQEVLLRLWRHQRGLDEERLGTWLLRVTRNACYDLLRRRRSAVALATRESLDADEAREVPSAEPDPESRAQTSDFRRSLVRALSGLGEPDKSIVLLREVHGVSHREIGEALGMPEVTVRVHLHRARRKLREQLREVYER
ncbi:MAG TPA: sigma-70 family RNA polymerase sigma factor [Thermoanaerobaculia bacterium]